MELYILNIELIGFLDQEWSDFLKTIPDSLGYNIEDGNRIFEHRVRKHLKRMSSKYNVPMEVLVSRYM